MKNVRDINSFNVGDVLVSKIDKRALFVVKEVNKKYVIAQLINVNGTDKGGTDGVVKDDEQAITRGVWDWFKFKHQFKNYANKF